MANAVRQFAKHNAVLKIVVKTRDEVELTNDWIEHHAGIVGLENILIADNQSSMPEVFDIYSAYGPGLNWFSFTGHQDRIHSAAAFPEIYAALSASCRYAAFVDMDERLIGFTESSWHADESLCARLGGCKAPLVSAPWLQNTPSRDDQFDLYKEQLEWGILFGKPLISTTNPSLGNGLIHTVQYPAKEAAFLGLGVLHLSNLSVTQRLRTNKNKLTQLGVADAQASYKEIASISIDPGLPEALVSARCIEEIRRLLPEMERGSDTPSGAVPDQRVVSLRADHSLGFGSSSVRELFTTFLQHEKEWSDKILPPAPLFVPDVTAQ